MPFLRQPSQADIKDFAVASACRVIVVFKCHFQMSENKCDKVQCLFNKARH